MIYILGRRSSTKAMVGALLKTTRTEGLIYYCSSCLRSHPFHQSYDKTHINSQTEDSFIKVNRNINKSDIIRPLSVKQIQEKQVHKPQKAVKSEEKVDVEQFVDVVTPSYTLLKCLHSSIDVCFTNGMELEAYHLFHTCRTKTKWKSIVVHCKKHLVFVYNALLKALSVKGYWNLIQHVTKWMESDGVLLTNESFAAMLCCLGKIRTSENKDMIYQETSSILRELLLRDIQPSEIFFSSNLALEDVEGVLKLIREVIPNFEIQPLRTDLSSSCSLTKDLHSKNFQLSSPLGDFQTKDLINFVEEQINIEKKYLVKVKAVSRGNKHKVSAETARLYDELKNQWEESLRKGMLNTLQQHKKKLSKSSDWCDLYIFLSSVPVEKLVELLLETTLDLVKTSPGFSPAREQISRRIGIRVLQSYQIRKKELFGLTDATEKLFKNYCHWYVDPQGPAMNGRQKWQLLMQDWGFTNQLNENIVKWPDEIKIKVGKCLLDIILKEVKFTAPTKYGKKDFPVLYIMLRYRDCKFQEEIKCHPTVASMLEKIGFDYMYFPADEMPMVCPPRPWKSVDHGGYLLLPSKIVRPVLGVQGKILNLRRVPQTDLYAVFDALNSLQAIPWKINEDVLNVVLDVFKKGGSNELNVPEMPREVEFKKPNFENLSWKEIMETLKERKELQKESCNQYGLWCECLYRLSLADHFRKRIFWMPQNCDFRGRVYPVPPLLNHLGSDLFRSLLIFAKGEPLGPKGLDWIKIHLINLTGTHKKKSVEERLMYANEILPDILDSAERPLTGNRWWAKADDPWQTLSVCMEIKKILSSPNPENYVCRLPVHQDGSCNGLQHYAALGKDVDGARSVNLAPHDTPQDVYLAVVDLIEKERAKDAESGLEIAKILEGFIERKVVKQTIMTTVYGVTFYGAQLQIRRRLEEIPGFPQEHIKAAAKYLSFKTFSCLGQMFSSARQIQEWFVNCAGEICRQNDYVQWRSPLGLPVLQSYGRLTRNSKSETVVVPDSIKQKNAFPPNFVHSLDSCHMMLTALYCEQARLTFAAVHDCFWTHANSVDVMNRICREQFISLHSQPILENLSEFFKNTYSIDDGCMHQRNRIFEAVPGKGEFDLKKIMNSVYFFS